VTADPAERAGDFLRLLPQSERTALEALGRQTSFPPGSTLMQAGQHGDLVMVLLRGVAKITYVTPAGTETLLGFCREGELVGELSVVDRHPRSSTVIAVGPVEALVVPASRFRGFVESTPLVGFAMLQSLSNRFRDADRRIVEFGAADALGRVASRILELSEDYGQPTAQGIEITLPLSQDELAGWAGCSKKATVNALRALRGLGCIQTGRRRITVVDAAGLRARTASL
jgi:CRP/FNR family cyclic AMP-dependent transcriptional regulator